MTTPRVSGTIDSLSPSEWERRLTAHYLREDGPFGGAALQYLDATPAEIASAAGFEGATDAEAQAAFLAQFDYGAVADWLDGRRTASPYSDTPGYFRYLVLSALVTATDEGAGNSHNFRTRLGRLLGRVQAMQAVSGVNDLWTALSVWAKGRREAGHPIRPIALPSPGLANRIGIAVKIAFPSWRDRQALTSILENLPPQVRRSVSRLTRELARPHYTGLCSPNLAATFDDFAAGLAAGRADLADHRFWRLVESVEQRLEDRRRAPDLTRWRFEATFNGPEQDVVEIEVLRRDGRGHDREPVFQGAFLAFLEVSAQRIPNDLVRAREGGVLVLGEVPGGVWALDDLGTPKSSSVVILARAGSAVHSAPLMDYRAVDGEVARRIIVEDGLAREGASGRKVLVALKGGTGVCLTLERHPDGARDVASTDGLEDLPLHIIDERVFDGDRLRDRFYAVPGVTLGPKIGVLNWCLDADFLKAVLSRLRRAAGGGFPFNRNQVEQVVQMLGRARLAPSNGEDLRPIVARLAVTSKA